jgi:hypothetical protein
MKEVGNTLLCGDDVVVNCDRPVCAVSTTTFPTG